MTVRPVRIPVQDSSVGRDSMGPDSNPGLVCQYFSNPVTFGAMPIPG